MHSSGLTHSSIVEVDPRTGETVWRYSGSPDSQFFSGHISGAERLEGGHVLITEGTSGRIFEVTSRGEVVWEWISPFLTMRRDQPLSWVFRSYRYKLDHPALAGRELDPPATASSTRPPPRAQPRPRPERLAGALRLRGPPCALCARRSPVRARRRGHGPAPARRAADRPSPSVNPAPSLGVDRTCTG